MECTGGEEKIQVYKIPLYNLLWERDCYRDLDHSLDSFEEDFGSEQLGKGKERTFKSITENGAKSRKV